MWLLPARTVLGTGLNAKNVAVGTHLKWVSGITARLNKMAGIFDLFKMAFVRKATEQEYERYMRVRNRCGNPSNPVLVNGTSYGVNNTVIWMEE